MRTFTRHSVAITADVDGIAEAQTLSSAGDIAIDGAAVVSDAGSPYDGQALLDPPRRVVITSSGDDSGLTFTIYGTDRAGTPISETVQGTNASAATSLMVYKTVSRIAVSGATDGDVEIGWGTEHIGPWIILGNALGHYVASYQLQVSGTVNVDIERTYSNILRDRIRGDYDESATDLVSGKTAGETGAIETPVAAIRLVQNSGSGTATLRVVLSRAP